MSSENNSGWSTPASSSVTLSPPQSPSGKQQFFQHAHIFHNPRLQASNIIEHIASQSKNSSTVYIYDIAQQVGFGAVTKSAAALGSETAQVVEVQTRAGAGLALIGRLSQGTSRDAAAGATLTAYTTPNGLAMMAPSFAYLPSANSASRLVLQVPTVSAVGESLTLSPSLASLVSIWSMLPQNIVVLLSSTPQQSVDFATLSYQLKSSHVVHLFDHHSSSREYGHPISPLPKEENHNYSTDISRALKHAGYTFFEYFGDKYAHTVLVFLNGPLALAAKLLISCQNGLGAVIVNVLRPWNEAALRAVIPTSTKTIHVFDDVPNNLSQGSLHGDVFSTVWNSSGDVAVHTQRVTPAQTQQYLAKNHAFLHYLNNFVPKTQQIPQNFPSYSKKLLFMGTSKSSLSGFSQIVEELFLDNQGISARLLTDYDAFSKPGGVMATRLLLSSKLSLKEFVPMPIALPLDPTSNGETDFLAILDHTLLKTHSVVNYAKHGSTVLVAGPWTPDEYAVNLPSDVVSTMSKRDLHIYTMNVKDIATKIVGATGPANDVIQTILAHCIFLRLYLGAGVNENTIFKVAQKAFGNSIQGLRRINAEAWTALQEVHLPMITEPSSLNQAHLKNFKFNAIAVDMEDGDVFVNGARHETWHQAAKHLMFPAIYATHSELHLENGSYPRNPALHPEVPDHTYLVTCTVNRRLTPLEYDRNVFHLEFDTSGTGLKYAIGEALGVHGWNDEQDVLEFCTFYGVSPQRLVAIPVSSEDSKVHTRTVLQALQQQIDLFGRPPNSFYTDLAAYATNSVEKHALLFIGSPEGSSTFKKLSEKDTVTFADVLKTYPSARPGIETLCELIGDIKPRHYSIASAQSAVGDRVDLLIVIVDWDTPNGVKRYGQCTRYLNSLKIGQKVTVSIKPSVMKLPANPKQPLIMAGLGTGAAPFRAFLQHLAWLKERGEEVGPVYYYFGSRNQAAEYLYGEEIEAFILGGVISRAGLAFSRDGKKKVYIQHKMLEDSEALAKMLNEQEGVFYLCGPTWPVPDVYEALLNALVKYQGSTLKEAGEFIENLKEEERYVLEVY